VRSAAARWETPVSLQVEAAPVGLLQEARQAVETLRPFGDAGEARKGHERVQVVVEALHEGPRPGQPDQGDLRLREGRAQRPEGRDGAEQVPQVEARTTTTRWGSGSPSPGGAGVADMALK